MKREIELNLLKSGYNLIPIEHLNQDLVDTKNFHFEVVESLLQGPSSLFKTLELSQPHTFRQLISCVDLGILERPKVGRPGTIDLLYLDFESHIITTRFLNKGLINRRKRKSGVLPEKLNALPAEFRSYYQYFDGLNLPKNNVPIGLSNQSLPKVLSDWMSVKDFIFEYEIKTSMNLKELIWRLHSCGSKSMTLS